MLAIRSYFAPAFVALALLTVQGCAKPVRIVSQASPNPMHVESKFTLKGLSFEDVRLGGKTEKQYTAGKTEDKAESWDGDKSEMIAAFERGFINQQDTLHTGDRGNFVVTANCAFVEPGYFAVVASGAAELRIRVKIMGADGAAIDEIEVTTRNAGFSKRMRLKAAAMDAGAAVAKYLNERIAARPDRKVGQAR